MEHDDALEIIKMIYWNHLNERHGCSDMGRDGCDEWNSSLEGDAVVNYFGTIIPLPTGCKHTRTIARLMDEKFGTDEEESSE